MPCGLGKIYQHLERNLLPQISTLRTEKSMFLHNSVNFYQNTQLHIQEDSILHSYCCKNLKCNMDFRDRTNGKKIENTAQWKLHNCYSVCVCVECVQKYITATSAYKNICATLIHNSAQGIRRYTTAKPHRCLSEDARVKVRRYFHMNCSSCMADSCT